MRAHQAQLANFDADEKAQSALRTTIKNSPENQSSTLAQHLTTTTKEPDVLINTGVLKDQESTTGGTTVQLTQQILIAKRSLREQVQKAEQELQIKTRETEILKNKIAGAKELLKAETDRFDLLKTAILTNKRKNNKPLLLNGRWISKQRTDSYIIQLASSTKDAELIEYARRLSSHGPLAIYPFKKTKDGKLLYGLSSGLYGSSTEATKAAALLPIESAQNGSWIRKVADVSSQIATFQ